MRMPYCALVSSIRAKQYIRWLNRKILRSKQGGQFFHLNVLEPNNILIGQFWLKMVLRTKGAGWGILKRYFKFGPILKKNWTKSLYLNFFILCWIVEGQWFGYFFENGANLKYLLWLPHLYIYLCKEVRPKQNIVKGQ